MIMDRLATPNELKNLLIEAAAEIDTLRRRNEVLQAKVDGFELAGRLLTASEPHSAMGYSEDVAWRMRQEAERLQNVNDRKAMDTVSARTVSE
jgi:hypothetical protein